MHQLTNTSTLDLQVHEVHPLFASERKGNNVEGFKDLHLIAKAEIWPWVEQGSAARAGLSPDVIV